MSDKKKFPRADAIKVAKELCDTLRPYTDRLIVAGSLRRRKALVGDVEILFIPKFEERALDFFSRVKVSLVDDVLSCLLQKEIVARRTNVNGSEMWGEKNKLAVQAKGWKWNPYGPGFTTPGGTIHPATSERDVFDLAGLPFLEPWQR